jgi:hypothetical protein
VFRVGVRIAVPAVQTMLAHVQRPPVVLTEPWHVSIATLVSAHPKVPSIAARPLRRFDKFGSVTIGPARVGFDGKTIRWNRIIEIRTYPNASYIPPSVVINRESDRVREMLPPIPGRRRIVRAVAGGAVTVLSAFTPQPRQSPETAPLLPCEIVYRNVVGRRTSLSAGLFAATVLTQIPEASNSLLTMAAGHNVPVRAVPDGVSARRAARSDRVQGIAVKAATRFRTT